MNEALDACHDKAMHSRGSASEDTYDLAHTSGAFERFGHPVSYEMSCYASTNGQYRILGTQPRHNTI
jgi:hypothetical protein